MVEGNYSKMNGVHVVIMHSQWMPCPSHLFCVVLSDSIANVYVAALGWSRMNVSVHVNAPWRSTSVPATSPLLKTGPYRSQAL